MANKNPVANPVWKSQGHFVKNLKEIKEKEDNKEREREREKKTGNS